MVSTSLAHWSRSVHSAPGRLVRCVRANASPNTAIMTSLRSTTSYLVSTKEEKNVGQLLISTPVRRDLLPLLDEHRVNLYFVSIGTPERGVEFCARNEFPENRLLADPESQVYVALGLKKSVQATFFDRATPEAMRAQFENGKIEDLKSVLREWIRYKLWIPPKQDQAFQQGGVFVFEGDECVLEWRDRATGDHVDFDRVLEACRV